MNKSKKSKKKEQSLNEEQKTIMKIAERLRELRKAKGYSSIDIFAYEHDIDRSQYGRYERGHDLRVSTLVRLLKAFDVTIDEFFADWGKQ